MVLYKYRSSINNDILAGAKALLHQVEKGPGDIFRLPYPSNQQGIADGLIEIVPVGLRQAIP